MHELEIYVDKELKVKRNVEHTNIPQLLNSIVGMIDYSEFHKGNAKSMAKELSKKGAK